MKIKERIDESGLTVDQASAKAGIDRSRLEALIAGAEPSVVELRDLAAALRISISDFLPSTQPEQEASLVFRQGAQNSWGKRSAKAPVESFSRKVGQAFELLPDAKRPPDWLAALRPAGQAYDDAEKQAEKFRDLFFGGNSVAPILDLPAICVEKLDIILYLVDHSKFEGASALVGGHPFVFLSRRTFLPRMLFTLAHEIGHLIAHHESEDFAALDGTGELEQMKRQRRTDEAFANAFASCLLLPRAGVGIALRKIKEALKARRDAIGDIELMYLARLFGVSFQVAARRCEDVGLLPSDGAASLYDAVRKSHGNPEKYADQIGLPKRARIDFPALPPRLLHDAIEAVRSGRVSIGRASAILDLSIADIFRIHAGAWQTS